MPSSLLQETAEWRKSSAWANQNNWNIVTMRQAKGWLSNKDWRRVIDPLVGKIVGANSFDFSIFDPVVQNNRRYGNDLVIYFRRGWDAVVTSLETWQQLKYELDRRSTSRKVFQDIDDTATLFLYKLTIFALKQQIEAEIKRCPTSPSSDAVLSKIKYSFCFWSDVNSAKALNTWDLIGATMST